MADLFQSRKNKTPVEVNRLSRENVNALALWCEGVEVIEHDAMDHDKTFAAINVPTCVGPERAQEGDYIVFREDMGFLVYRPWGFDMLYEPVK